MKEKIKKILRIIIAIIAILWIFGEITSDYPDPVIIGGVVVIWGICMYSLKEKKTEKLTNS